jgi:parallel beta-helix repeat protein
MTVCCAAMLLAFIIGCEKNNGGDGGGGVTYTTISGDTSGTLALAQSPFLVTGDLRVPEGQTLVIEPGVNLLFDGLYWLKVEGRLLAEGNTSDAIVFTSHSSVPTYGDWRNIIFTNPNVQSRMAYCVVQYGARYDTTMPYYAYRGGISVVNSSPIIDHTVIYFCGYNGIFVDSGGAPTITNNIIIQNDDNGIYCLPGCNPVIRFNDVWNNHSQDWSGVPVGIGDKSQLNINLDSCDVNSNISFDPELPLINANRYNTSAAPVSCSPCINAGDTTFVTDPDNTPTDVGAHYYHIGLDEIRKKVEGTLSASLSPYRVTCDAFVLPGRSLVIPAGVTVEFEGLYEFRVYGSLVVNGTAGAQVMITPSVTTAGPNPPRGYWKYLAFASTSNHNSLTYCNIDHGKAITLDADSGLTAPDLTMDHVTVRDMLEYGLHARYTMPVLRNCAFYGTGNSCIALDSLGFGGAPAPADTSLISNCIVQGAAGRGISLAYYRAPIIRNCVIYDNGTSGIHCEWRCTPTIVNNTIYGNHYYGIYCWWNSDPVIMNNIVVNSSWYGLNCVYSSVPTISYNDVWNNYLNQSVDSLRINYQDCSPGFGDISADPGFVDVSGDNFHLNGSSPAHNAGNPDPAYNDALDGSRNDMGAYGGPFGNW